MTRTACRSASPSFWSIWSCRERVLRAWACVRGCDSTTALSLSRNSGTGAGGSSFFSISTRPAEAMGALPVPGILMGAYPERRGAVDDAFARLSMRVREALAGFGGWRVRQYTRFVDAVKACEAAQQGQTQSQLERQLAQLRASFTRDGFTDRHVAQAFCIAKQACRRALGIELYDAQLMAARIMLDGRLAEMATGEGKTVAA